MKNCSQCKFRVSGIPVCLCSVFLWAVLVLAVVLLGAIFFRDAMIAVFTALGTIATSTMCFLAWKSNEIHQKQFNALNAAHIIARFEWDWNADGVLFILENTGAMPADSVSVKFPQWFDIEVDKINQTAKKKYADSMVQTLRKNQRPIQGHTKMAFLLFMGKANLTALNKDHKAVHVKLTWRDLNNNLVTNEHDLDLIDEIITGWEPLSRIAKSLDIIAKPIKKMGKKKGDEQ